MSRIAATTAGEKPATVMNLTDSRGKLFSLWNEFGHCLFAGRCIDYYELRKNERSAIVLFFSKDRLEKILQMADVKEFLSYLGYSVDKPIDDLLSLLKKRYNPYSFPHEIGVFLGIPLKDVKGFMGLSSLPCTQRSKWKVYGEREESLRVLRRYKQAEERVRKRLLAGEDPLEILNRVL